MKTGNWPIFLLCGSLLWSPGAICAGSEPAAAWHFSPQPTDAELSAARVLDEPLVPLTQQSNAEEDRALATALTGYAQRAIPDDCSSLEAFARNFPNSRWTGPLLLHLGTEYYNYGYYSQALASWERAWVLCQNVRSGPAKPEADRALGELARMYSKVGRLSELARLLDANQVRNLDGPGTQLIHAAHMARWVMENQPDYAFGCGPSALDRILLRLDPAKAGNPYLLECKSTTNGFSLTQVAEIAAHLGMRYQMAYRQPGADVVLPAVVNWKVGHYAALVERRGDRLLAQDYTFRDTVWITTRALEAEASGYFLVPMGALPAGWRAVSRAEGQSVRGKGLDSGNNTDGTGKHDKTCGGSRCKPCKQPCPGGSSGMTTYTMHAMLASLTLEDTPVGFVSPVGPQVAFTVTYNQLEANQPANFYYSNLGPKWDCNWLTYVADNPNAPGADVALYEDGGGTLRYSNFNLQTQAYAVEAMSQSRLVRLSASSYELQYPDGSRREYAESDGATGSTRRIFLTQEIDPAGNVVQLNYDAQLRITNIVNAIGQSMTLAYTNAAFPFAITSVTDPFGRTAYLQYGANGLLTQITDTLGMTSQYTYGANQFVTGLATPYGVTTFATGITNGGSYLLATDPLGGSELLVSSQNFPIPPSVPAAEVPHGLSTFNLFMQARDSFFWDKQAYAAGAWDWTKAHIYHWLHQSPAGSLAARILESEKDPLESRIWYNYPGEYTNFGAPYYLDAAYSGASDKPTVMARVLDDGTTQARNFQYNAFGLTTNSTDPVGRNFTFVYATNNVDLLEVRMTHNGKNELVASATYNSQHQPLTATDASGRTMKFTYNARGQTLTYSDPRNQTTSFSYDSNGFLTAISGPLVGTNDTIMFTYDSYNRLNSVTDTEGYRISTAYDIFDRPVLTTYPDGTSEQSVYDRLDLVATRDRLGRWTTNTFDANRRLTSVRDPLGRQTWLTWYAGGMLHSLIDPLGHSTTWTYDLQGRPILKHYADGSSAAYTYDLAGRQHTQQDAKGQLTVYEYYPDDTLKSKSYQNALVPTPAVSYTFDPDYNRLATMQDGMGLTVYAYNPVGVIAAPGAAELRSVTGPLTNAVVSFGYDELGNVTNRSINGVAESWTYDLLNRPETAVNALGQFRYSYVNATTRVAAVACPNSQTELYAYYDNLGDHRLQQILNLKPDGTLLSGFGYTFDAAGQILAWTNQWDALPTQVWHFGHDAADQLTTAVRAEGAAVVATNSYSYDAAGNRILAVANGGTNQAWYNALNENSGISPGPSNSLAYEWDAANRLSAINQGVLRSQFQYDGLDRRTRIVESSNGVVLADNYFVWSGAELKEMRDANGATLRRFYPQGEALASPGGPDSLIYTRDHLGSIREAVDQTGMLQARYDYDPFGQQTALTAGLAPSFGYTGHYQHRVSGLYLSLYRPLDPRSGRWLARDPIEETAGLNLYAYCGNNPVRLVDPLGEDWGDYIPISERGLRAANNFAAGFADTISFSLSGYARRAIYGCDGVNPKSSAYTAGQWTGVGWQVAFGAAGAAKAGGAILANQTAPTIGGRVLAGTVGRGFAAVGAEASATEWSVISATALPTKAAFKAAAIMNKDNSPAKCSCQ
jgi:RHS repeat-associated protein